MRLFKIFIENFIIFGLGGIISHLVPIIMIPVVTRMLPDMSYYGVSDISNTLVSFGSAVAIMGMYDAMYRMFFEKENDNIYERQVCTTALVFTFCSSLIITLVLVWKKTVIAQIFFGDNRYSDLIYIIALSIFTSGTNTIIAAPTRMQNKRKTYIITNSISPLIAYTVSIILIIKKHYMIALPMGVAISGILMEIVFGILNFRWFVWTGFSLDLLKQLLKISLPLFPNFLIYWIFNSCDRLMITNLMSISDVGIYSIGSKFGHISQLIYLAFAGGWQFFAFSTMKEKGQVQTNSLVFEYLGVISYIAASIMCVISNGLFKLLFEGEYISGYIVSPYLFLAPLLQMLFQVISNQFLVIKKTWPILLILGQGAIINILFNFVLIPEIGIEGAAIATLLGYAVSDFICILILIKIKLAVISKRFIIMTLIFTGYLVGWRLVFQYRMSILFITQIALISLTVLLYKKELFFLLLELKKMKSNIRE